MDPIKAACLSCLIFGYCGLSVGQEIPPWFPKAPSLPAPQGQVIHVATVDELLAAVDHVPAGGTILLADGQYKLPRPVVLDQKQSIFLRSASGDATRVTLSGKGWGSGGQDDDILHVSHCEGVTIADLSFADCRSYGIKVEAEHAPKDIHILNCRFRDIGVRAIKGSAGQDPNIRAVKGSVRGCYFENSKVPPADWLFGGDYIAAIDMMALEDWTFSENVFRNIKGRNGGGRAAIFIWVRSRRVVVEGNVIVNCDRGVAFGNPGGSTANIAGERLAYVSEGIIRNNFIAGGSDCGIELWYAERIKVFNNSIWRPERNWSRGIRIGTGTVDTEIANNLVHGSIQSEGGEARVHHNLAGRLDGYFEDPASGNLALSSGAAGAIGQGISLPEVAEDIRRRPRVGSPDLGAWESETKANLAGSSASGPLRVHPSNPRYLADGSGKAILLTGSHTWGNLQDYRYSSLPSPAPMDFGAYLDFLKRHHHNFFRLWVWETAMNPGAKSGTIYYDPMPYLRSGPENALDGKPRFDLTRFNPAYFERLRARVKAARDCGIYAAVMLFNGFSIEGKGNVGGDPWQGHPFNPKNNINGIDGGTGTATHTLSNSTITTFQEAYIRKVIDTVNDLDNVLYEISNEDTASPADTDWQYHMIRFIKSYEAATPKQHPVGMTAAWPGTDDILFQSPADWVSPAAKLPVADGRKVVINDTDHSYFWIGLKQDGPAAQRAWAWENFTSGNQCLFMDPYLDPSHDPGRNEPVDGKPDPYWDDLRRAMGQIRKYAERMNLSAAVPHPELASSRFCLADVGKEYLVFLPQGGEVTVDLSAAQGNLNAEWFRPSDGTLVSAHPIEGGGKRSLKAPFTGDAVLYVWSSR